MTFPTCYLFEGLSAPQIGLIQAAAHRRTVQAGQWLFHQGDPAEALYLIEDGAVELLIEAQGDPVENLYHIEECVLELLPEERDDVEIPISLIRPGHGCFGVGALVAPYRHGLSARCARDGGLVVIRGAEIRDLMRKQPELGCRIMTNLSRKLLDRLNETRREVQVHFMGLVRSAKY